ncbi:MAG TPA: hypothetical protein VGM67_06620 [Gemmatimonadaceae bacterium]|jgi:hypothetical protein
MPHTQFPGVTPNEWIDKTSLRLSRRTSGLVKLDVAYANFYSNRHSQLYAGRLLDALEAYKKEAGGNWAASERNRKGGGLFAETEAWVLAEAEQRGWWKAGTGDKGAAALATYDIPHSRYGVLFLLGNTTVGIDSWSVALEGLSTVGGAVGTGFTTDVGHLDSSILANPTVDLNGLDVQQSALVGLGTIVPKAASRVIATPTTKIATKSVGSGPVDSSSYGFPCSRAGIEAIEEDPALFLNPFVLGGTLIVGAGLLVADVLNNLRKMLVDLVTSLYEHMKGKLMVDGSWPWDVAGGLVKKMIKLIVGKCLKACAPLIGGLMDLGTGLAKTFAAAKERIGAWLLRRKISLNEGHPTQIANSIEGEMNKGIFVGLWAVLKGIASLALQSFLPGAGNLVNAVVTGVEWLVKCVWRLWEESKIAKFLLVARGHYERERQLASMMPVLAPSVPGRTSHGVEFEPCRDRSKGGIIHNLEAFKTFFQSGCDASPVIPMLTLNSGICGSLMTLLKMFDGREEAMISQQTFNDGAEYFSRLKAYGRKYMKSSGFTFQSSNPSVTGYLGHAISHHQRVQPTSAKVIAALAG